MKKNFKSVLGVLVLDKPIDMTSNRALQIIKRLFFAKKAGHTGSLDPLATGVLPILFGEGTKFSQYLLDADKKYVVEAKLGVRTDTSDKEGTVVETRPVPFIDEIQFKEILKEFTGTISQIPSMFSAIKHQGQPLYKFARQGIEIDRPARNIQIYELKLLNLKKDFFELEVFCSKGTYIRTLVDDIGERLGCGAHVTALRRTQAGPFDLAQAVSLDMIKCMAEQDTSDALEKLLLPLYSITSNWPLLHLPSSAAYYLNHGQPVSVANPPEQGHVALASPEKKFLGIGEVMADGRVAPRRMLKVPEWIDVAEV